MILVASHDDDMMCYQLYGCHQRVRCTWNIIDSPSLRTVEFAICIFE